MQVAAVAGNTAMLAGSTIKIWLYTLKLPEPHKPSAVAGHTALPAGSTVTFANGHSAESTSQLAEQSAGPPEVLSNLVVRHVQLDPLVRGQLSRLDLAQAK